MTGKIRQTVDTSESDREYVREFENDVAMLCGMVQEMFIENKAMLLSPVLRDLIIEKAARTQVKLRKLQNKLAADNPCDDFK